MYRYVNRKGIEKFSLLCVHTSGVPPLANATLIFNIFSTRSGPHTHRMEFSGFCLSSDTIHPMLDNIITTRYQVL